MSTDLEPIPSPGGEPPEGAEHPGDDLGRLTEVTVELAVEVGRTFMSLGEAMSLGPGSVVTLDRLADKPVDLLINGRSIARGEVVVIDEQFGLRITEVVNPRAFVPQDEDAADFVSLDAPALSIAPDPAQLEGDPADGEVPAEPADIAPVADEPAAADEPPAAEAA